MTRSQHLIGVIAAALACLSPASAEPLDKSPITPGFWTWSRTRLPTPQAVVESCRTKFAIQYSDGRYFGILLRRDGKELRPPQLDEVGHCKFNRGAQVENCEIRVNNPDGTTTTGAMESRFSTDAGVIRMSVTPTEKGVTGKPFDVYTAPCAADVVFNALNGVEPPK